MHIVDWSILFCKNECEFVSSREQNYVLTKPIYVFPKIEILRFITYQWIHMDKNEVFTNLIHENDSHIIDWSVGHLCKNK